MGKRRMLTVSAMTFTVFVGTMSPAWAATYFDYTVDFKANLQGRNMSGYTVYCNNFRATFRETGFDPSITIQLKENNSWGTDPGFATVTYPTDGATYRYCWTGFVAKKTYYFMYRKANNTKTVRGVGTVGD